VGPNGGPSWVCIAASTPGRSARSRSVTVPAATLDCHCVQPISPPNACAIKVSSHCAAGRPRTGTATRATSNAQIGSHPNASSQSWRFSAASSGTPASTTRASCTPDRPKNQPLRSLE
jgi:hypothetical protein